jgi:hypothetical protein
MRRCAVRDAMAAMRYAAICCARAPARARGATFPGDRAASTVARIIKNPPDDRRRSKRNVPSASSHRMATLRNLRPRVIHARTKIRPDLAFKRVSKRNRSSQQLDNTPYARAHLLRSPRHSLIAASAAIASSRRVRLIARALGPLPQVRDKHGNSDHAHRDSGDPTGGPAQPHSQDHGGKQDREQR